MHSMWLISSVWMLCRNLCKKHYDKHYKNKYKLEFLYEFRNDLIKPISRDGKEHIDYVPTQVISEFLKFEFSKRSKNRVEGILYNSSKNNGTCLVLFWDNTQCLDNLELLDLDTSNLNYIKSWQGVR